MVNGGVIWVFHARVTLPSILRVRGTMPIDQISVKKDGALGLLLRDFGP